MVHKSAGQSSETPVDVVRRLLGGFRVSQALYVVAKLGIPDLLASKAVSADELARATGTESASLARVLRLLAGVGVLDEQEPSTFALTAIGEVLRTGAPGDLRTVAVFEGEVHYPTFGALLHTVERGVSAYEHLNGQNFFQHLASDPDRARQFQDSMTAGAKVIAQAVVEAYDFSSFEKVVDVGGGHGALLAAVLHANRNVRGILFDRSYVVARARPLLERSGVLDRCEIRNGEFFKSVPSGGDAYLMSRVIHDWGDERASVILRNCHEAMKRGGKVLVIDRLIQLGGQPNDAQGLMALFSDLSMLVLGGSAEAKERTVDEFRLLFRRAGFQLLQVIPTSAGYFIMEGGAA